MEGSGIVMPSLVPLVRGLSGACPKPVARPVRSLVPGPRGGYVITYPSPRVGRASDAATGQRSSARESYRTRDKRRSSKPGLGPTRGHRPEDS